VNGEKAGQADPKLEPELDPRAVPIQDRAKKTLGQILDTAATLLEEVGVDTFNTNLLAERAGVGIRTVYRYFPNKLAVIVALSERLSARLEAAATDFDGLADPSRDWRAEWCGLVDAYIEALEREPGGLAIRRAVQALPELRSVDWSELRRSISALGAALERRGIRASEVSAQTVARLLIESNESIVDDALERFGRMPSDVAEQLKLMQTSYLAQILD
jgi:AcrR family transcriptional regulator